MAEQVQASHQDLERRVSEMTGDPATLYAITSPISGANELKSVLADAIAMIMQVTGAAAGTIRLVDPETNKFMVSSYVGLSETYVREALLATGDDEMLAEVLRSGQPAIASDLVQDPRTRQSPLLWDGLRSAVYLPLKTPKRNLGVVVLGSGEPGRFTASQGELFAAISRQISTTIENVRLFKEAERRRVEAEELARIIGILTERLDVSVVGQRIVESVLKLLVVDSATLWLLQPDGSTLAAASAGAARDRYPPGKAVMPPGTGMPGRAVREGAPVWSGDVLSDNIPYSEEIRGLFNTWGSVAALAVPFRMQGKIIGALVASDRVGRKFSDGEVSLLQTFASQAGLAFEQARLHEETDRRRREAEELAEVARTLTESLDVKAVAERIVEGVRRLLDVGDSTVYQLQDGQSLFALAVSGGSGLRKAGFGLPVGTGVAGQAVVRGEPVFSTDILHDPKIVLGELHERLEPPGDRSVLAVPLRSKRQIIGALSVSGQVGRWFTEAEVSLLQNFGDQAALALENACLYEQTERRGREAEELARVAQFLAESLDMAAVGERIVTSVRDLFGVKAAMLRRLQPDGSLRTLASSGESLSVASGGDVLPTGMGLAGAAVAEGRPIWSADVLNDPKIPLTDQMRDHQLRSGNRSMIVVPLRAHEKTIGSLGLSDRTGRIYSNREVALLQTFGDQAALALENARLYEETERRLRETAALLDIARVLDSALELKLVLKEIALRTAQAVGMERCSIFLWNEGRLQPVMSQFADGHAVPELWRAFKGMGRYRVEEVPGFAEAIQLRQPVVVEDAATIDSGPRGWAEIFSGRTILVVPLIRRDAVVGVLQLDNTTGPRSLRPDQITLAGTIASQVTLAIDSARLYEETQRRNLELQALYTVTNTTTQSLDIKSLTEAALVTMIEVLGVDAGRLYVFDETDHMLRLTAHHGLPVDELGALQYYAPEEGIVGRIFAENRPVVFADLSSDSSYAAMSRSGKGKAWGFSSAAGLPITAKGQPVGVIYVYGRAARKFTPQDLKLLSVFGEQIGVALENARLFEETERRRREAEELGRVSRTLTESLDVSEVGQRIAESVLPLFAAHDAFVWLVQPDGSMVVLASTSSAGDLLAPGYVFPPGVGLPARAIVEGRAIWSGDVLSESDIRLPDDLRRALADSGRTAALVVPLRVKAKAIGALVIRDRTGRAFSKDEVALLETFAAQGALALENARLFEETERRRGEAEELARVARSLTESLEVDEVATRIVDGVRRLLKVPESTVFQLQTDGSLVAVALSGVLKDDGRKAGYVLSPGTGVSGRAVARGEPVYCADILRDVEITKTDVHQHLEASGIRAVVSTPIRSKGQIIGALAAGDQVGRVYTEADIALLQTFGDQAALAMENARLYEAERTRQEQLSAVRKVGQEVATELELEPLLHLIVRRAVELAGVSSGIVYTLEDAVLVPRAWWNLGPWLSDVRFRLGQGIPGIVAQSGQAMIVNDYLNSPYVNPLFKEHSTVTALIAMPLISKGTVVGVITINNSTTNRRFSEADQATLALFAPQAASAIENARLFEETRRLVGELGATTKELGAKNKELDTFVYTVSHDLKAPLVTLQGMTDLLAESCEKDLDEQGRHYVTRIKANAQQMERLVQDLLALSRAGREGRAPEAVALDEVTDEILMEWGERIRARGATVTRHELPTLWGVRTQIEQVMSNLVGNAIKYLGDTPAPVVEIGAKEGGEMVECYVKDNGIGIDPAYHEKIFEIFQRLKETEAEGTGVGLAIVKKIIEGAGGRIWVESAKGQGAAFRFTWPRAEVTV